MKDCGKCERLFDNALYDELLVSDKEFFDVHISACKDCAKKFDELRETLTLVKMHGRPEPGKEFMENFWNELEPKLADEKPAGRGWILNLFNFLRFDFPMPYKLAGAALILVVGIFIGRYWTAGNGNTGNTLFSNQGIKNTDLKVETARYLQRSKILLLGLMNFDPATDDAETISLPHIKKISRALVNEAPALKAGLDKSSSQQLGKLVSDLEVILLQIANLEAENNVDGIEMVKDGVNSRGIFLKINIQQLLQNNSEMNAQKDNNKKVNKENRKI